MTRYEDMPVQIESRWWKKLSVAGPGLVFVLSIVGPRDLVASSVAGSEHG